MILPRYIKRRWKGVNSDNIYLTNVWQLFQNGLLSALPYLVNWIISIPSGLLSDKLSANSSASRGLLQKSFNSAAFYGPAAGLIGLAFAGCDRTAVIALLCVAVGLNGCVNAGFLVEFCAKNRLNSCPNMRDLLLRS